ncbi:MAG: hypothetical protein WCF03_16330 [Nitrososphaeraceae archaeon]
MDFVYNGWLISLLSAQVGILEITFKKKDQAKPKGKTIKVNNKR